SVLIKLIKALHQKMKLIPNWQLKKTIKSSTNTLLSSQTTTTPDLLKQSRGFLLAVGQQGINLHEMPYLCKSSLAGF
ncbi:hypothetical protein, partial [Bifidobacterium crudilactis]